jgi:ABC-type sugar transport system substrate-binding protein
MTGKIALAALLATAMLALTTAVKAEEEWRLMWTNPRVQQVPKSAAILPTQPGHYLGATAYIRDTH